MKEYLSWLNLLRARTEQAQKESSERRKIEEERHQSEQKYRLVFENASDAIFVLHDRQIRFSNRRTTELLGCDVQELMRTPFRDFVFPDDRQMLAAYHDGPVGPLHEPQSCTFRIVNKAGEKLWVQAAIVPVTWQGQPATLNFLRDISQQRKLEEQFQKVQRMESIGTLAGGIAHDFNNLLMGILGNVSLALMDIPPSDPAYERIRNIEKYVQNGIDLTRQLLGFARGGRYEVNPVDVNDIVREQNSLFKRTYSEITLHEQLADGLWITEADQGQIKQVLMNLYVNARQAMPGGGDLFVQTDNVAIGPDYDCPYEVKPGRYLRISVTDTGVGMDKSTVQKIFEPFFTTRTMGRGTGLGLASVYGIVKNHGGFINVYSEKGKGTTFTVYLPASEKAVPPPPEPGAIIRGSGTILLVDDRDMIVNTGGEMLQKLGYRVLSASSGRQALELYTRRRLDIDLVILDLIMPDMGGGEVYDRLLRTDPGVRVILSSGYSLNGEAEQILARGCDGFIQKPFSLNTLSAKIREILEEND
jgi:PAS domain S-box-containing protein